MSRLRRAWAALSEWTRARPFLSALIVFTLIAGVGFWRTQQLADQQAATSRQQADDNQARIEAEESIVRALHADLRCIERWANATTDRNQTLTPLANKRLGLLFASLEESLVHHHPVAARKLAHQALMANDAYNKAQRSHPIPVPRLACKLLLKEPPKPTKTPSKPAPKPKTVTSTTPGPTITSTIRLPGKTTTITAPPGKHRRSHGQ